MEKWSLRNEICLAIHLCLGGRTTPEAGEQPSPASQPDDRELCLIWVTPGDESLGKMLLEYKWCLENPLGDVGPSSCPCSSCASRSSLPSPGCITPALVLATQASPSPDNPLPSPPTRCLWVTSHLFPFSHVSLMLPIWALSAVPSLLLRRLSTAASPQLIPSCRSKPPCHSGARALPKTKTH